ncbi:Sigma-70 factor [hydrothermal vent metagenome]|uniref:Sigma-70 factor n=1 Tax=hydrothermal vent metagenome TaxID=652676 RepID=A0A3B1BEU9_9ZZZZ
MKDSRRIKRIIRHHQRGQNSTASLNMVSLMDIFTILVFFLLVSSTDSEILPTPKAVNLPESSAEKLPMQTLVIMVNGRDIRINDKIIVPVKQVMANQKTSIPALRQALNDYRKGVSSRTVKINRSAVTIMGDRKIPYKLLKKIMLTCAGSKFTHISLAVLKKSAGGI